jgi:hypothetical protein
MTQWKRFFNHRAVIQAEIKHWPFKEQELAISVYGLIKNIEAIDFVPLVLGLIPVALICRGIESGFIPLPVALAGKYAGPLLVGTTALIYAATAAALSQLVVKKLQMKWITELFQKLAADKELAAAYDKLERLDPYVNWRIRNTFLRLNKLF